MDEILTGVYVCIAGQVLQQYLSFNAYVPNIELIDLVSRMCLENT